MEYLQAKVSRLSKHAVAEKSRTIVRGFAKDGLMDDGKEDLLERKCGSSLVRQGCSRAIPKLTLVTVGRLRMACNLVSQYVAHDLYSALIAKYEYVSLFRRVSHLVPSFANTGDFDFCVVSQRLTRISRH
jgi:ribonuclease H2 subunit B